MSSEDELRKLLAGIDIIGTENALALHIMLATCVRSVELIKARWAHIDFERGTWFVPDESVKTRVGFPVPITPTVASWFREPSRPADGDERVPPARRARNRGKHVGNTTLWTAIDPERRRTLEI